MVCSLVTVFYQCQSLLVLILFCGYTRRYRCGKLGEEHAGTRYYFLQLLVSLKIISK